jgi:hypothetical protein
LRHIKVHAGGAFRFDRYSKRRLAMTKSILAILMAVAASAIFTLADSASAASKKKVSFEQAWKLCKAELDRDKVPNTTGQSNERYIRGGACMKKHGYEL